ncbi:hypothetical protein QJS10_CPB04g01818 [Acorus calamus]|uniref:Uncharacterized protein n=1 Tax=Acorus calamus TaxID=4465 RepID=A0AAV9F1I7_ACOCL|nr:hypothetical protein QJS10_CPB04g01818 [Acorus calamus]
MVVGGRGWRPGCVWLTGVHGWSAGLSVVTGVAEGLGGDGFVPKRGERLQPPYGDLYLAVKKHHVGLNCEARQLRALVDEKGILLASHVVTGIADR